MSGGPWGIIVLYLGVNAFMSVMKGEVPSIFTIASLLVMVASLIGFMALTHVTGSDPLGAGSGGIVTSKIFTLTAFVGSIVAFSFTAEVGLPPFLMLFINVAFGTITVGAALHAAKA